MNTVQWGDVAGKFFNLYDVQLIDIIPLYIDELRADITQIDLRDCTQQEAALQRLAQRVHFPDYFGGNLDALYDCVSEQLSNPQAFNQVWLLRTTPAQQKLLFPIRDTLCDAMSEAQGITLSVAWWINNLEPQSST